MGAAQSEEPSETYSLFQNPGDAPRQRSFYCCCLRKKIKLSSLYGGRQADQIYPLHEYPMLIDPVAFRIHSALVDRKLDKAVLKFAQNSGHVSLQDRPCDDVTMASPLVAFCLNTGPIDADVAMALEQARVGNDVFLVVVKLVGPNSQYTNALSLSTKNRRRIGACGVLTYSTDSKKFQETDDNLDMLRRLRHFLLDAIVEID